MCSKPAPGDVRAEAAADLEESLGDELAEGLADGRPADPVAVHELDLGLDLGVRRELARPDPVADVGLDPAVEAAGAATALMERSSGRASAIIP